MIGPNVTLGDNVFIGAYAVIGTHAECTNLVDEFHDEEGVVTIGSGTVIRDHVTIHGSSMPHGRTIIGANCYIQAHAHIGHDAELAEDVTIACHAIVAGHVKVGRWANFGLGAITHQFADIAEGVMLGAQCFVKGETTPFTIYVGVPARAKGINEKALEKQAKSLTEEGTHVVE